MKSVATMILNVLPRRGAIEALGEAKQHGKVRFIRFTGHTNPSVHLNMLKYDFPFDACQLPLNVFARLTAVLNGRFFRNFSGEVLRPLP